MKKKKDYFMILDLSFTIRTNFADVLLSILSYKSAAKLSKVFISIGSLSRTLYIMIQVLQTKVEMTRRRQTEELHEKEKLDLIYFKLMGYILV